MAKVNEEEKIKIAEINRDLIYIKDIMDDIKTDLKTLPDRFVAMIEYRSFTNAQDKLNDVFARKDEIELIKKLVYGCVATILIAFVGEITNFVIKH